VVGSKRAATLGGSTPPSKRFNGAWEPWYVEQLCSRQLPFIYLYYIQLNFLLTSTLATSAMGSGVGGAPGASRAQDAPEGASTQESLTVVAGGDGDPAPDTTTVVETMASLTTSGATACDPVVLTGPPVGVSPSPPHMEATTASTGADDNAFEETEVIMGHPNLRAPGTVSLSEVMGTAHVVGLGVGLPTQAADDL
jgi:hypothetical protein